MLLSQLSTDLTTALKAGDKSRVDTLRFLIAAIKKHEIDAYPPSSGKTMPEEDVVKIVQKQIKQHQESIVAFEKGGRAELAAKEKVELEILKSYAPTELTDAELEVMVAKIVAAGGAANFGQVMGQVMKEVAGRADGSRVTPMVKKVLNI